MYRPFNLFTKIILKKTISLYATDKLYAYKFTRYTTNEAFTVREL